MSAAAAADKALLGEFGIPGPTFEGYLFPDTYDLAPGMSARQIAELQLQRFRKGSLAFEDVFDDRGHGTMRLELPSAARHFAPTLVLGIAFFIVVAWMLSSDRKRFPWRVVIGGLVSSTAVTLSFAKRSREEGGGSVNALAAGLLIGLERERVLVDLGQKDRVIPGLELQVFMVRVSYNQKPYRRALMETYGARCVASPSRA